MIELGVVTALGMVIVAKLTEYIMASSRMTAPKGRTYDRTIPDGSDLHKRLACRTVPHMSQTRR